MLNDQVLAGVLEFDDGTKLERGEIPNGAIDSARITFPRKTFSSLKFTVTKVSRPNRKLGLSEIEVY